MDDSKLMPLNHPSKTKTLPAALRMQLTPANKAEFPGLTLERAVADYIVAGMLLFFVTWNFMG
jgi:oligosaccharyltransferase complex subunit epsilon